MSDSEDEYGPIDTSWGLQTSSLTTSNEPKGWDSLLDPNIKQGPNGLGAGNLHRKGRNFKPIGEEYILAQRLNKPQSKKTTAKQLETKPGSRNGADNKHKKKPVETNGTRKTQQNKTINAVPSTTRVPKLFNGDNSNGASKWLQSSLVDEPFWEKKKVYKKKKSYCIYIYVLNSSFF